MPNDKSPSAFRAALQSSSYGGVVPRSTFTRGKGWSTAYDVVPNSRQAVEDSIMTEAAKANVRARNAALAMDTSRNSSNARTAFAMGRAAGTRKKYAGNRMKAFGSIGRLDKANIAEKNAQDENAAELSVLNSQAQRDREETRRMMERSQARQSQRQPIQIFY